MADQRDDQLDNPLSPRSARQLIERLTRELDAIREKNRRAEEERQRGEEKRQRDEEKRQRDEEKLRNIERLVQPTTFHEQIIYSHNSMASKFRVKTDAKSTTKGTIAAPKDKFCPSSLEPWDDFANSAESILRAIKDTLPDDNALFKCKSHMDALGNVAFSRSVGSERSLEFVIHLSVETSVSHIIKVLTGVEDTRDVFKLGDGICFENYGHAGTWLEEALELVQNQESYPLLKATANTAATSAETVTTSMSPKTPNGKLDVAKLRPDQICIYRSSGMNNKESVIYICEYKAPHKLTVENIRQGLCPIDVCRDIASSDKVPTQEPAKSEHDSKTFTASAVTQTYNYMIEAGLEYGILTTGEANVFLKIDWSTPGTLYYHLCVPVRDEFSLDEPPLADAVANYMQTSIGQYLAFTLMALSSKTVGQDMRENAKANLNRWQMDLNLSAESLPTQKPLSPEYRTHNQQPFDRSPIQTRATTQKRKLDQAAVDDDELETDRLGRIFDDDEASQPDSPTPVRRFASCRPASGSGSRSRDDPGPDPKTGSQERSGTTLGSASGSGRGAGSRSRSGSGAGSGSRSGSGAASRSRSSSAAALGPKSGSGAISKKASSSKSSSRAASRLSSAAALALASDPESEPSDDEDKDQDRPYCTQKCLLGLVRGEFLDPSCPNIALHCMRSAHAATTGRSKRHPISHERFLTLMQEQMKKTLDRGISMIGLGGARGVLFKVTLLMYGYTFVCKGTAEVLAKHLEHEARVYKRLEPLQGKHVPVFLGSVDLKPLGRQYWYDFGIYLVHMMFLSWSGENFYSYLPAGYTDSKLEEMAIKSLKKVHVFGVVHTDVRLANLLFNPETKTVMVIDFERSVLIAPEKMHRPPLAPMAANKRRRLSAGQYEDMKNDPSVSRTERKIARAFQVDMNALVLEFCRCPKTEKKE